MSGSEPSLYIMSTVQTAGESENEESKQERKKRPFTYVELCVLLGFNFVQPG